MELKKVTIPVLLALFSLIFLVACLGVYLSKGKSAKWIARKMKLGGIMLSLSAILSACDPSQTAVLNDQNPPFTCYMVAYNDSVGDSRQNTENIFYINNKEDSLITLNFPLNNTIEGVIKNRKAEKFSFSVLDSVKEIVQKDNIEASDGSYNETEEAFKIKIDKSLKNGDYEIRFYISDKDSQYVWTNQYINLKIK